MFSNKLIATYYSCSCILYHCKSCNLEFPKYHAYMKHKRKIDEPKKPKPNGLQMCYICGKMVLVRSLRIHMQGHNPVRQLHICEFCGKAFKLKHYLNIHLRKHTGEMSYLCEICGVKLLHTKAYKEHMRRHRGERPFKCLQCEKAFLRKGHMQRHMLRHEGELVLTNNNEL